MNLCVCMLYEILCNALNQKGCLKIHEVSSSSTMTTCFKSPALHLEEEEGQRDIEGGGGVARNCVLGADINMGGMGGGRGLLQSKDRPFGQYRIKYAPYSYQAQIV